MTGTSAPVPSARASSNGQFFVFNSISSLTGFNNTDAVTGNPDNEIFLYDAGTGSLSCASCSPERRGSDRQHEHRRRAERRFRRRRITILARYVSDSGQVFFDTPNALLPADTDGAADTYEYEGGNAVADLERDRPDGSAVHRQHAGRKQRDFCDQHMPLVPQDTDGGAYDIYDARVGGGFPVSTPTPACQGEGCKPPQSAPLATPSPGSSTFTGPGNSKSGASAKITIVKRTVKRAHFSLRVKVAAAGQIVVTGGSINRASRSVKRAGTYTLTVHLTRKAKNRLKHKRKLKLSMRVQYLPSAGSASTVKLNSTAKA